MKQITIAFHLFLTFTLKLFLFSFVDLNFQLDISFSAVLIFNA